MQQVSYLAKIFFCLHQYLAGKYSKHAIPKVSKVPRNVNLALIAPVSSTAAVEKMLQWCQVVGNTLFDLPTEGLT